MKKNDLFFVGSVGCELAVINLIMKKFNVTHDNVGEVWKTWNNVTKCKYVTSLLGCLAVFEAVWFGVLNIIEYLICKQKSKEMNKK